MNLPATFRYGTLVWLTSIVAVPVLLVIWTAVDKIMKNGSIWKIFSKDGLEFAVIMLFVGGILSIPSWILLMWIADGVVKLDWNEWERKLLLFGVGSLLTLLPFYILNCGDFLNIFEFKNAYSIILPYWLTITFGIFLYRMPNPFITLKEYFNFELQADRKHEFIDGRIVAMAYTSEQHGKIASNLNRLLGNCLIGKACDVYSGDRMLFVKECNQVFYPDLLIVCGEHKFHQAGPKMKATLNPSVVIEILSDSTEHLDKTSKTRCYKKIPGLRQIVFFSQKEQHVRILENEDGKWVDTEFYEPEDIPRIGDCDLPLQEIYRRVEFGESNG